jgi:iron complex outermembrane recepter protein
LNTLRLKIAAGALYLGAVFAPSIHALGQETGNAGGSITHDNTGTPVLAQGAAGSADNVAQPTTNSGQTSESSLEEIIVTAEKRNTDLQRTAISMTALSGKTLDEEQVRSLNDITDLAPNFQIGSVDGYQQITIRGIGIENYTPAFDSTVSVNVNGVNVSRPIAQATSLFDVAQIEVLRGPQGTLYGRNATAGSVNINTTLPTDEISGYGKVIVGNYQDVEVEGAVGGPIIDHVLLVRVAGFSESRGGYGVNLVTGSPVDNKIAQGARATVVFTPFADFKATLIAERYTDNDNDGTEHYFGAVGLSGRPGALGLPPTFQVFGGYTTTNPWNIANGVDPKFQLDTTTFTGTLDWDLEPFSFRSISGYRGQDSYQATSISAGSVNVLQFDSGEPAYQFSEELQAHYDSSRLHATVGIYYFSEEDHYAPAAILASGQYLNLIIPLPVARPPAQMFDFLELGGLFETEAEAAFAQATYDVVGGLSVTAGIRYSYEHKKLFQSFGVMVDEPYVGSDTPRPPGIEVPAETFTATTPKFGLQYQLDPETMAYLTYSKGFKAGGFDTGTDPASRFQPELLTDYELGVKSAWLDNRLTTDVDGFFYDYSNLQVSELIGVSTATVNAAAAHVYGIEAEFRAVPIDSLTINGYMTWLHARYTNYFGADPALPLLTTNSDFSGKALNNSPDFTAHLSVQYAWPLYGGSLALRGEANYSSKYFFAPDNLPLLSQGAYTKGDAFLTYTSEQRWYTTGFVRNVSNAATKVSGIVNNSFVGNVVQGSYAPPRTFGLEVGYRF